MFGSRDWLSVVRCDWSAVVVVKVNAEDGGLCSEFDCVGGNWSADSMAACSGSRREVSISESVGSGVCVEGAGGGGMDFDVAARASQELFSSSSLWSR